MIDRVSEKKKDGERGERENNGERGGRDLRNLKAVHASAKWSEVWWALKRDTQSGGGCVSLILLYTGHRRDAVAS